MAQADTDATSDNNVTRFPGAAPEAQQRPKDPTAAKRSKRYRKNRKRDAKRDGDGAVHQSNRDGKTAPGEETHQTEKINEIKPSVTVRDAPPLVPDAGVHLRTERHGAAVDLVAYAAAVALAGAVVWQP